MSLACDRLTAVFPLFPVQKCLLGIIKPPHHWNISYMLHRKNGWSSDVLRAVVHALCSYHEVFRFRFAGAGDAYCQALYEDPLDSCVFEEIDLRKAADTIPAIHSEMMRAQRTIDVFRGPVFILHLYRTNAGDYIYTVVNHLLIDGMSVKMIIDDILLGYSRVEKGLDIRFQNKTGHYLDALDQVTLFKERAIASGEIDFWRRFIAADDFLLPVDNPVRSGDRIERNMTSTGIAVLDGDDYPRLKRICKTHKVRDFDFYLTVLGIVLSSFSRQPRVSIRIVNHGRDWDIGELDVRRTAGPFWVSYPVSLSPDTGEDPLGETRKTEKILRAVPHSGRGYEIAKAMELDAKRSDARSDSTGEILFNYVGFLNEYTRMSGDSSVSVPPFLVDFNRSPDAACPYALIFNLRQIGKSLHMQVIYNKLEFQPNTVKRLLSEFSLRLRNSLALLSNAGGKAGCKDT